MRLDSAADIARAHDLRAALGLPGGQLVANPIPDDNQIPASEPEPLIYRAAREAQQQGISAKDVTPFLLNRIFELTHGRSLKANIALICNNARVAAAIAAEINTALTSRG